MALRFTKYAFCEKKLKRTGGATVPFPNPSPIAKRHPLPYPIPSYLIGWYVRLKFLAPGCIVFIAHDGATLHRTVHRVNVPLVQLVCHTFLLWVMPKFHLFTLAVKKPTNNLFQIYVWPFLLYFLPPPSTHRWRCYFQTEICIHLPPSCH